MDTFSTEKRSLIMSRIGGKNTKPELIVRSILHRMGYRFRIHRKDLPGSPDIVLPKHKKIILVHGCFWHGHSNCTRARRPTTNRVFWNEKIDRNIERDKRFQAELLNLGWDVLVVWQCQTRDQGKLAEVLEAFLNGKRS